MVDVDEIAKDWAERGFSCETWVDPPGQKWEGFTHPTDEIVMVLEGEMEFELDGEILHPQVGDELLIPAGIVHAARNIGVGAAHWMFGYRTKDV